MFFLCSIDGIAALASQRKRCLGLPQPQRCTERCGMAKLGNLVKSAAQSAAQSASQSACHRKRLLRARQAQRGNPGYVRVEGMRVRGMVCVARANDAYIIYLRRHALHVGVSGRLRDTQSR